MSQKTMVRPTITDDDGTGTTGTILNAAFFTDVWNRIDAMITNAYKSKSANYTALNTDDLIECTSGSFTVSLHAASDATRGLNPLTVKNSGSGTVTIDANGSETIDGDLTLTLAPGWSVTLQSNGTNWIITMAFLPKVVRYQRIEVGSVLITSGTVGNRDVTIGAGITDYTKCVLYPAREMNSLTGTYNETAKFFKQATGGSGTTNIEKSPELAGNTTLRFVIAANGSAGDVTVYYGIRIVEYY